eukprot:353560_1
MFEVEYSELLLLSLLLRVVRPSLLLSVLMFLYEINSDVFARVPRTFSFPPRARQSPKVSCDARPPHAQPGVVSCGVAGESILVGSSADAINISDVSGHPTTTQGEHPHRDTRN